ncbi:MAG: MMPL family transporter [Myxococcales bacterium]|nr:MMPL family transporter [Myxococcales bacterium]
MAALLLAVAAGYCLTHFRLTTSIAQYLPGDTERSLGPIIGGLSDGPLARTRILTLGGAPEASLRRAASLLASELERHPGVLRVDRGVGEETTRAFYELYFPRRFNFLSSAPERAYPERFSAPALTEAARELKRQLGSPAGSMVRMIAEADPLLLFPARLEALRKAAAGGPELRDGQFFSRDGAWAVLFVATQPSAFDGTAQTKLQRAIERGFAEVRTKLDPKQAAGLSLEHTGVGRFALEIEHSIRSDTRRVSMLSTVAVLLLLLLAFHSLRVVALTALVIGSALLTASAASLALYGEIHGVTLAFGAALIGVCVDYPLHFFNHHAASPGARDPWRSMAEVWSALWLGALTTVAGLMGLGLTELPGARELAVFGIAGVLAALLISRFVLPALTPAQLPQGRLVRALSVRAAPTLQALHARRSSLRGLLGAALLLTATGLLTVRWSTDVAQWAPPSPALAAEDARVRKRVDAAEAGRLVVVRAPALEEALERNDRVAQALTAARANGELGSFTSLHSHLWSETLQRRNFEALRQVDDALGRVQRALDAVGFDAARFAALGEALSAPFEPLRRKDLQDSAIASMTSSFFLDLEGEAAILTFLRDVRAPEALRTRLESIEGALYFDQRALTGDLFQRYQQGTWQLVGLGLLAVLLMLALRYRKLAPCLVSFAPALIAAAATLALVAAAGQVLTLFHAVALLLVLSIGVDYGVFVVESRAGHSSSGLTSVAIACLSTACSFGLLAVSQVPALSALGATVGIGVLLALLLTPVVAAVVGLASDDDAGAREVAG